MFMRKFNIFAFDKRCTKSSFQDNIISFYHMKTVSGRKKKQFSNETFVNNVNESSISKFKQVGYLYLKDPVSAG